MFYLIGGIVLFLIIVMLLVRARRNRHSILYQEGVRNENNGRYRQAINNFLEAKSEMEKDKNRQKQLLAINERIKTLHALIDYESNFHKNEHPGIA